MAEAIESRRKELGISPGEFIERTGLTGPGLAPLRRGERRKYQERLTIPVCEVLGWTSDSIDRLLAGEPPVVLETHSASLTRTLADLVRQIQQLEVAVESLVQAQHRLSMDFREWRDEQPPAMRAER